MKLYFLIFLALFISIESLSADNDTVPALQKDLEEVVVQSFKYGKDFTTLPLAASTVGAVDLDNRQSTSTKDLMLFSPNLFIPDYGSRLTSPVYIRGIGSKINAPSVGLYVDGIPYFEKSSFDFDLNDIDRAEILRGPQGTLYGRNTMGGLVNIYTKSPLMHNKTSIGAEFGNYGFLKGNASFSRSNSENTFGAAISGNFTHSAGYFTNLFTGKKADVLNSGNSRIRFDWRAKPDLTFRFTSTLDYLSQGGYPYGVMDADGNTGEVNYNEPGHYDRIISSSGLTVIYSGDGYSLNSQTSYQYLSDVQKIDQDFSPSDNYFALQEQRQSAVSQEITIKSNNNGKYRWLTGIFAFYQDIDNEVILEYRAQKYSTDKIYGTPTKGVSVYHQSVFEDLLADGLSLTLGLRYDYEQATDDYLAYRDTTGRRDKTDAFVSNLSFSQLTPKIALQYSFADRKMLYASVAKGYKTGGFNTSFSRDEDRSFEPEYSWNYEAGFKGAFIGNRLKIDACLFYIDWRKQQIYQPMPSGIGQMLKNAGRSESRGAELSLYADITENLHLQANWGYTQAIFKEYQRSETIDYSGNYLPFVPKQTVSAGLDYDIPLFKRIFDRIMLNLTYSGIDRLYWSEDNAVSQPYYGLLNGKLSISKSNFNISFWAKNITNTEYSAYYFESMGKRFAQKGKPFIAGISMSLHL